MCPSIMMKFLQCRRHEYDIDLAISRQIPISAQDNAEIAIKQPCLGENTKTSKTNSKGSHFSHEKAGSRLTPDLKRQKANESKKVRASLSNTQGKDASSPNKRKKNLSLFSTNISELQVIAEVLEAPLPEDAVLFPAFFESNRTKRSRQAKAELSWEPKNITVINTEFSRPETVMLVPRVLTHRATGQEYSSMQTSNTQVLVLDATSQATTLTVVAVDEEIPLYPEPQSKRNEITPSLFPKNLAPFAPTKEFIMAQESLFQIIPLEVLQHIMENDSQCPAWTKNAQRCLIKHHAKPITSLVLDLTNGGASALLPAIQRLIELIFCSVHRRTASKKIEGWKADLQKISCFHGFQTALSSRSPRLSALASWVYLLREEALSKDSQGSSAPANPQMRSPTLMSIINPIQEFKPYSAKNSTRNLSEELVRLLLKPLQPSDLKHEGSIYVFWQQPNFGHLKIGRSGDVRRRLKEWFKQCKKDISIHFPDSGNDGHDDLLDLAKVPHICRVEALVHMELMEYRRIEVKCPGCSKTHKEWFEISPDSAVQVVRKWMAWMRTQPYTKRVVGGQEQWLLKGEEMERLTELSQPSILSPTSSTRASKERLDSLRPRLSLASTGPKRRHQRGRVSI